MERYKLIRKYPGSLDIGTVVYAPHRMSAYSDYKYKMRNVGNTSNHIFYDSEYVEKFPEFWKKI